MKEAGGGASRWQGAPQELPPSLYEQAWRWLRALPWSRWRSRATPVIQGGAEQLGELVRVAVRRGAPYTVKLARATAGSLLLRAIPLTVARVIHLVGFPAVVLRTALQLTVVHRTGLATDEVVFFRLDDPAGYTVYEAPARLGTAAAVAFLPTAVLAALSLLCLVPAMAPGSTLHLPVTWLTWVQLWLGFSFAAHALPTYEETGPLAEQTRVGIAQADPAALLWAIPSHAVAVVTRFGGILPAALGALTMHWLSRAVFGL